MTVKTVTPDELFTLARSFVEDVGKLREKKRSRSLTEEEVRRRGQALSDAFWADWRAQPRTVVDALKSELRELKHQADPVVKSRVFCTFLQA